MKRGANLTLLVLSIFLISLVSANSPPLNLPDCTESEFENLWNEHFYETIENEEIEILESDYSCKVLGKVLQGESVYFAYLDQSLTLSDEVFNFYIFQGVLTAEGKSKVEELSLDEISVEDLELLVNFPDYWATASRTFEEASGSLTAYFDLTPATFTENPTNFEYTTTLERQADTQGSISYSDAGTVLKNSQVNSYSYSHERIINEEYYQPLNQTKEIVKIQVTTDQDLQEELILSEFFSNALSVQMTEQSNDQNGTAILTSEFNSTTNSLFLKPLENFSGELEITLKISNQVDTVTKKVLVSVSDAVKPVLRKSITPVTLSKGQTRKIELLDYFADAQNLTFKVSATPNFNLVIDGSKLKISIKNNFIGISTPTITATNPSGASISAPITITSKDLNAEILTNVGLVVEHSTNTKERIFYVGEKIGLFIYVAGENLRYSWEVDGIPMGNPTENVYIEGLEAGNHSVVVTVTDGTDTLKHNWDVIVKRKLEITPGFIVALIIFIIIVLSILYLVTYLYLEKKKKANPQPLPSVVKNEVPSLAPNKEKTINKSLTPENPSIKSYLKNLKKDSSADMKEYSKNIKSKNDQSSNKIGQ